MRTVIISGHSDDVIVVSSDGMEEEFECYDGEKFLKMDDGTLIRCQFCPSDRPEYGWFFDAIETGEGTSILVETSQEFGKDKKDIQLVIKGNIYAIDLNDEEDGPSEEQMMESLEDLSRSDFKDVSDLESVYQALRRVAPHKTRSVRAEIR